MKRALLATAVVLMQSGVAANALAGAGAVGPEATAEEKGVHPMQGKIVSLSLLAAVVALPLAVGAQQVPAPTSASASGRDMAALEHRWAVPLMFNSFDTNKDGSISRQEARASSMLSSQFNQLDGNGDGMLSVDELGAADAPASTARAGN